MKHIYTSIDMGSDTIKIVVCELLQNKLNLLSASSYPSNGIKRGLIVDQERALSSLRAAINDVEAMLGITINKAITNVPSDFASYTMVKGEMTFNEDNYAISRDNVLEVLQRAMSTLKSANKEMVTIIPIDYMVDDKLGIKDPVGLVGKHLVVRAMLASVPKKNIYTTVQLLEQLGIEVVDISLSNIGDFYAFRNKSYNNKLGAIINIGSDITTVSLYNRGIIIKSSIINMGGKSIDNDIAYMYKVDINVARKLKHNFALAHIKGAKKNDIFKAKNTMQENIKISQLAVSQIVQSRFEEILNLAKKEISDLTSRQIDYIIITGGTSNMEDIEYVANDIFDENLSIGSIRVLGIRNNKYSSCIGNIVYFISKLKLKGKNYSMVNDDDAQTLATVRKSSSESSSDTMLGKIFGYFFSE